MKWNLRVQAAERGIWKSAELRRMLADAGLASCFHDGGWTVVAWDGESAPDLG